MAEPFTKLAQSILESSVWSEPHTTRIAWITLLAMKNRHGEVMSSIPGLANRARITVPEAEAAVRCFMRPDVYSRTKEHDGRRIEEIDGGWRVLNHEKYRDTWDADAEREYKRNWDKEHRPSGHQRAKEKAAQSDAVRCSPMPVRCQSEESPMHTDAYADTDKSKSFSSEANASTLLSSDDDLAGKPDPKSITKAEKQRRFAQAAVDAYNAKLTGEAGKLSAVTILSGARIKQANRCASLAAAFIRANFPKGMSARQFWALYFTEVDRDDFKSGRLKPKPGNGHDKWRPNFDYLTRESVVTQVLDDAMSRTDDEEGAE